MPLLILAEKIGTVISAHSLFTDDWSQYTVYDITISHHIFYLTQLNYELSLYDEVTA